MSSVSPHIKFNLFLVMSNQNFVLSDQDGVLVGHLSFQEKNIICGPAGLVLSAKDFFSMYTMGI